MQHTLETGMYLLGQFFLLPVLTLVALLFLYAFWLLGYFLYQAWLRRQGRGRPLLEHFRHQPEVSEEALELFAHRSLEPARIASRVTPMLGLVATMIPMGPALKSLADGNLAAVSENLMIAFSAVILALLAASITFWIANVRRRWLAEEMVEILALGTRREAP